MKPELKQELIFPQTKGDVLYLDSAATTLKSQRLIDLTTEYYSHHVSNIHRGVHSLANAMTHEYEMTRESIASFTNANPSEVIFTSGATDSANLLALILEDEIKNGDNIVLSIAEHHSNILPWQNLAKRKGATLSYVRIDRDFELDLNHLKELITSRTKLITLFHRSNVTGLLNNCSKIREIIKEAPTKPYLCYDSTQTLAHDKIDFKMLGADFLFASSHKAYGPTGLGILLIKEALQEKLTRNVRTGGGVVKDVTTTDATYLTGPHFYEAGTPNLAAVIPFKGIIEDLKSYQKEMLVEKIHAIRDRWYKKLTDDFPNARVIGNRMPTTILSFIMKNAHPDDYGQLLSEQKIMVRTGHHCASPLMHELNISGTIRISFGVHNIENCDAEMNRFFAALNKAQKILGV